MGDIIYIDVSLASDMGDILYIDTTLFNDNINTKTDKLKKKTLMRNNNTIQINFLV